jgi:hypothetical protein
VRPEGRTVADGIMGRLAEAWSSFRHLYDGTRSRGRMYWGETDVRLIVAHLLLSSEGRDIYVDPDVTGFLGFGAVDLVVEEPETWTTETKAPWALVSRPSPVALAFTVRVIDHAKDLAELEGDARRLQAIVQRSIAKEAALCVLDRTGRIDRRLNAELFASFGILVFCALDPEAARSRV